MVAPRVALVIALVTAPFLAPLIMLAGAGAARAHASLVRAEPADGAVVPLAPAALALTFNEPVAPLVMRLIGPSGEPIALGAVVSENATVTIAAPPALQRGTHVLSWRVISADGHPVGGSVIFSIGAPSAQPATGAESLADGRVRALIWAVKVVLYVGLFVGVGGAFFRGWIAASASRAADAWLLALLGAGLVAAPISVGLQGLDVLDLPPSGLAQKSVWEAGLATSYGPTAIVAAFALFAGVFTVAASSPRAALASEASGQRGNSKVRGLSLAGLIGVGVALALSGHASTAEPRLFSRPALFLHAVCVAFWIGSLLPLCVSMRSTPHVSTELKRFSRVIPLPLSLLVATGIWLAVVQLDQIDALWTTSYGQVLASKLAAVTLLLSLAAANRYWLVPRFEARGAAGAFATALAFELAVALAILALVALWRFTPPPRALAMAAPVSVHLHGEKVMIEIERDRGPGRGANLLVLDGAFRPLAVKEVVLVLTNPLAGIEPMRRIATRTGESTWRIDDLRIPLAGRWSLRAEIVVGDFEKLTIEDTVALPRVP